MKVECGLWRVEEYRIEKRNFPGTSELGLQYVNTVLLEMAKFQSKILFSQVQIIDSRYWGISEKYLFL